MDGISRAGVIAGHALRAIAIPPRTPFFTDSYKTDVVYRTNLETSSATYAVIRIVETGV